MYPESDYLLLSGLQHLRFCPRQCALIHIEQLWKENFFTASGRVLHEKVHGGIGESRKIVRIERDLKISSQKLGITGNTDVVEFYSDGRIIPENISTENRNPIQAMKFNCVHKLYALRKC